MSLPKELTTITPLSKGLAIVVFIFLPFVGFLVGINYQSSLDQLHPFVNQSQSPRSSVSFTKVSSSLRDILLNKCTTKKTFPTMGMMCSGGIGYYMSKDDLPIHIDQSVIIIDPDAHPIHCSSLDKIACSRPVDGGEFTIPIFGTSINNNSHLNISIFDDKASYETTFSQKKVVNRLISSVEKGEVILQSNDITLRAFLDSPLPQGISYKYAREIVINGVKKLKLSNGLTLYASLTLTGIGQDDPRLFETEKKYAVPKIGWADGVYELTDPGAESQIVHTFFSNMSQLASPEKDVVNYIMQQLNAISPI